MKNLFLVVSRNLLSRTKNLYVWKDDGSKLLEAEVFQKKKKRFDFLTNLSYLVWFIFLSPTKTLRKPSSKVIHSPHVIFSHIIPAGR